MSPKDRLSAFGQQVGFAVSLESDVARAVGVPCLLANGDVGLCTIEKSYNPASRKPNERIGGAPHAVRITVDEGGDGRVYHADGTPLESPHRRRRQPPGLTFPSGRVAKPTRKRMSRRAT